MIATPTFELLDPTEGPLFDPSLGGAPTTTRTFGKTFTGATDPTSTVHMLAAGAPAAGGAGYVSLELISARVDGAAGSFVLLRPGTMGTGTEPWAAWRVAPGTGTG